jgi:hypothetical protein
VAQVAEAEILDPRPLERLSMQVRGNWRGPPPFLLPKALGALPAGGLAQAILPDLTPYATLQQLLDLVCRLRGESRARGREALARAGLQRLGERAVRELSMDQRRRAVLEDRVKALQPPMGEDRHQRGGAGPP